MGVALLLELRKQGWVQCDALDASLRPRLKGPTPPLHKGPTHQPSALDPSYVIGLSFKTLQRYMCTAHMYKARITIIAARKGNHMLHNAH